MICLFYWRAYNNFAKIVMLHRQLSEEEANQLFQTTLLLISQQNQAEKQRLSKARTANSPSLLALSPRSPPRPRRRDSTNHSPEPLLLDSLQLDLSPPKPIQLTTHKFSSDKSDSLPEPRENSPEEEAMEAEEGSEGAVALEGRDGEGSSVLEEGAEGGAAGQQVFLESEIKEVKRDLEIRSKGKVCKTQEINSSTGQVTGYHFYCKNDPDCTFDCCLEYAGRRNSKGEKYYRLVVVSEAHLSNCLEEEEEICFMKLTKLIDSMEEPIVKLLEGNGELKPKEILTLMARDFGEESHKFIYKGLQSKNYHKAAKKYFDNLIYKVKNGMGVL